MFTRGARFYRNDKYSTFLWLVYLICLYIALSDCRHKRSSTNKDSDFELLSCRDDFGQKMDWFFMYKLPKQRSHTNELVRQGHAFAFLTPSRSTAWTLSDKRITDPESMLANTLAQKNMAHVLTLAYNDQTPDQNTHASHGHAKGFAMINSRTGAGIWVSHSAPGFPTISATSGYDYPDTSSVYGQNFLCLSLNKDDMDKLGKHLQALHPYVYYSGPAVYVPTLQTKVPHIIRVINKQMGTKIPKPQTVVSDIIRTRDNMEIKLFAKRSSPEVDIFSEAIAPGLKTNLRVQSWLRSGGICLPKISTQGVWTESIKQLTLRTKSMGGSSALIDSPLIDAVRIDSRGEEINVTFGTFNDHSKWAVAENYANPWICIADLNRKDTQKKRAGGAACVKLLSVWTAYNSTWSSMLTTDNCMQSNSQASK